MATSDPTHRLAPRRALAALALLALAGCALLPGRPAGPRVPAPARKAVAGKEAPATLRAADGSRCQVTAERFAAIELGDRVWCIWGPADGRGRGAPSRVTQDDASPPLAAGDAAPTSSSSSAPPRGGAADTA